MAIPVGTPVEILPFTAAGCINNQGVVVKCCSEWKCLDEATGQMVAVAEYTVRYMTRNCNECAVFETTFCESELVILPAPVPLTQQRK